MTGKHTSNKAYGWEQSRRHDFSHPRLIYIREVSIMVSFVYENNLSCFQFFYETYVLGFISWYIVLICMLSYMASSGGCRKCVPIVKGIGIKLEKTSVE